LKYTAEPDLIHDFDVSVKADIEGLEAILAPQFDALFEMVQQDVHPSRHAHGEAMLHHLQDSARLRIRAVVFGSVLGNLEGTGARLLWSNTLSVWRIARRRGPRHLTTPIRRVVAWVGRKVRREIPWTPPLPVPDEGRVGREHVLAFNEISREIDESNRRFDELVRALDRHTERTMRRQDIRTVASAASAVVRFLMIQVVAFALVAAGVGALLRWLFSGLGLWGVVLSAVLAAAVVTLVLRPYLRRRFRRQMKQAATRLLASWIDLEYTLAVYSVGDLSVRHPAPVETPAEADPLLD
jgi:hypothetical protein